MQKTAIVLSCLILVSFFLPWMQLDMATTIGIYGWGHAIDPTTHTIDLSLARMIGKEFTGGYFSFIWIIPILSLGCIIYSATDRKNGYTWLTLWLSVITLLTSGALFIVARDHPALMAGGDAYISLQGTFHIGIFLALFCSVALWFLSVKNNAQQYRRCRKMTVLHIIIPLLIFICSIVVMVSHVMLDSLPGPVLFSFLPGWALGITASSILILIIAITVYRKQNDQARSGDNLEAEITTVPGIGGSANMAASVKAVSTEAGGSNGEAAGTLPFRVSGGGTFGSAEKSLSGNTRAVPETAPGRGRRTITVDLKYIYWAAGIIAAVAVLWFISALVVRKMGAGPESTFVERYGAQPDQTVNLTEELVLFIKETGGGIERKMNFYVLETSEPYKTLREIELDNHVLYNPVDTLLTVDIGSEKYLYMEYNGGGGSMGNVTVDYYLYCLDDNTYYNVTYHHYPETSSEISSFHTYGDTQAHALYYDYLFSKIRASDLYSREEFLLFIDRFCADPDFQLSRIRFPVSYKREVVDPLDHLFDPDRPRYDPDKNEYFKIVPVDRSEWKILGIESLTPFQDPNYDFMGEWVKYSPNHISFVSGWYGDDPSNIRTFEKIGGEWYLTYFW